MALHIILPSVVLMVLGVGAVIATLLIAAGHQDRTAADDSRKLAADIIGREQRILEKVVGDHGASAEAFEKLVRTLDPDWADARIGDDLVHHFGIASAFVIDGGGRTVYAWNNGARATGVDAVGRFAAGGLDAMLGRLRGGSAAPVFSFLTDSDGVSMAAAARMTAGVGAAGAPSNDAVLVFARSLSTEYLRDLGESFGLEALHLEGAADIPRAGAPPAGTLVTLPLAAVDGRHLGALAWRTDRPGSQLVGAVLGPVTIALLLMLGAGFVAVYRSHHAAAALRRSAGMLARSEERFRTFAESASDWLWESGPDHTYTFFSERLAEILGQRPETLLGTSLLNLETLQEELEDARRLRRDIGQGRAFRDVPCVAIRDDGCRRLLRISGRPVLDAEGAFQGYRGTGVDVTEQVGAAHEAVRLYDLLNDAVESISEGFVLFDADSKLVACNARYRSAYPLLADHLVPGVTFTDVLRIAALRGGYREAMNDLASWIQERLTRHTQHSRPSDHRLADGHWYRISERGTRSGGIVKILTDITELKRHEEALADKSALLQATFDNIVQGISVSDAEDRLVAWNANFLSVMEYPPALGRSGEPMRHFRDLDAGRGCTVSPVFAEGFGVDGAGPEASRRAFEIVWPDGKVVEARENAMPDGGVVATFTDITERKRFERVLAELSQSASRTMGSPFFHSLTASLSRALKAEYALIGVRAGPHTIRTVSVSAGGVIAPDFTFEINETGCRKEAGPAICFCPGGLGARLPVDSPLGGWDPGSCMGKTLFDSTGRPIGLIAIMSKGTLDRPATARALLDIFAVRAAAELERLDTETALQDSEHRYRQLVELAPYGIIIWDGTGILFANEAAARIFAAATPALLIGTSLPERFQTGTDGVLLGRLADPLADPLKSDGPPADDGADPVIEARITTCTGEVLDVEVGFYRFTHQGRPVSLVMFNDITHRKRAEVALQHAHKMQAVGELAGGIAHEFNNMLTAIGGFAHMAKRSLSDARRVELCVGEIIKASDRAASLTAQLLTFSRRGGTIVENVRHVGIARMIEELQGFLRPVLGERVRVKVEISDRSATVAVDPAALHQAIVNLAINGRDAMPDGGTIEINVAAYLPDIAFRERHPDLTALCYVAISVRDSGVGIDKAIIDRIFEPFFTTKEQGKGTGLGLPQVYSTATRAAGAVEVLSAPGQGSTFTLYLPTDTAATVDESGEVVELNDQLMAATVLLVEDEDQVRNFIRFTLEDMGLNVVTAVDGEDALSIFRAHGGAFDLVITDLIMPRAGGADVARAVQREAPDLPIIFMSGYAPQGEAKEAAMTEARGRAFLGKPIDPDRLATTVRAMLGPLP